MEEALRKRKLGSVTSRRLRIQERQSVQEECRAQRIARRRQLAASIDETESSLGETDDLVAPLAPAHPQQTLSVSVSRTSTSTIKQPPIRRKPLPQRARLSHRTKLPHIAKLSKEFPTERVAPSFSPPLPCQNTSEISFRKIMDQHFKPKIPGSTTTRTPPPSDAQFDLYAATMDDSWSFIEDFSSSDDEDVTIMPIEVAKPISLSTPKARPTVISISCSPPSKVAQLAAKESAKEGPLTVRISKSQYLKEGAQRTQADINPLRCQLPAETSNTSASLSSSPSIYVRRASQWSGLQRRTSLPSIITGSRSAPGPSRMSSIRNAIRSSTFALMSPKPKLNNISEEPVDESKTPKEARTPISTSTSAPMQSHQSSTPRTVKSFHEMATVDRVPPTPSLISISTTDSEAEAPRKSQTRRRSLEHMPSYLNTAKNSFNTGNIQDLKLRNYNQPTLTLDKTLPPLPSTTTTMITTTTLTTTEMLDAFPMTPLVLAPAPAPASMTALASTSSSSIKLPARNPRRISYRPFPQSPTHDPIQRPYSTLGFASR